MTGAMISMEIDDRQIKAKIRALMAFGQNPSAAMRDIATYGEASTRERFRDQVAPDGNRWKPSIRVQISGGKTLTKDGHLGDSVSNKSNATVAEWGVNRIYAAIHQFGGNTGRKLRTKIVARPYLGVNAADENEILNLLQARIDGVMSHAS